MHSVIKLFNLFLASVSLCLFICPIGDWEVGKLPVASPQDVISISTPWQSHSGTLILNCTDFYPCDEAQSSTQELPSVWVFIFHLYDSMSSSSSAPSSGVLKPAVFRRGFIYGATILKILNSADVVRDAAIVLVIWCLCAAALVGLVCWVSPPGRRPSRDLLVCGSPPGRSRRRHLPPQWRRALSCLRPYIIAGMFLYTISPVMVSISPVLVSTGASLFNLTKSVGSSTARLLSTITELPLAKPAADVSYRLGNLLLSSVGTPKEIAKGFVSLCLAATLCCLYTCMFVALFLRTSDVKRPKVLDMTSGFLVTLHTRSTTSGTLDGDGKTGLEQLVTPRVWFKCSKVQYETPRVSLLSDVEHSKENPETKTHGGILHQSVQNVSGETEAPQESLQTGRSSPTQQSPSTIESESFSTLQLSSDTSQDLMAQQQSCQKTESCETAVSEQKSAHSVGSESSTPIQSFCDPEACDGTLLSQKSSPVPKAVVSEPKSSQLFEFGSSTASFQPLLKVEVCDRPSQDKPETIVSELKSPQLNGSGHEKQSQAPLKDEIVSVTTTLNLAQPIGSESPSPSQPPSNKRTREEEPVLQQLSSQHNDSGTSILEEKTTRAKRSGSLATLQPSLEPNISGRSLSLQQPQQTVANGSSTPLPSHHKKQERTVLIEQPSKVDGSQGSFLHAHSSPQKELRKTGVHLPLQNDLQRNASKRPVLIHQIQIPRGSGGFSSSPTSNERPVLIQLKPKPIGITFRESVPLNALQNKAYGQFYQQYLQSKRQVNPSFKSANPVGQRVSSPDSVRKAQNATTNQSSQPTGSGRPMLIQQQPSTLNGLSVNNSVALHTLQNKGDMIQNDPLQHPTLESKGNEKPALLQSPRTHEAGGLDPLTQSSVPGRSLPIQQTLRYNGPVQYLPFARPIASEGSMPAKESSKPINGSGKSKSAQQRMPEPNHCSKLMIPLRHTQGPLVPMRPRLLFKRSDWVKSVQQPPQTSGIRLPAPVQSTEQALRSGTIDSLTTFSVLGKSTPSQPSSRYNGPSRVQQSDKTKTSKVSMPPHQQNPRYNGPSQIQQSANTKISEVTMPPQQYPRYNGPSQIQQSAKTKISEASPRFNGPSQVQQSVKPITSELFKPPQQYYPRYNGPSQIQQSVKPITSEASPRFNGPSQVQQSAKPITSELFKPTQQYPRYNGPTQVQQSVKPKTSEDSPRYNGPTQVQHCAQPILSEGCMPPKQPPKYNGPTQSAQTITVDGFMPPQQSPRYNESTQTKVQKFGQPILSAGSMPQRQPPQPCRPNGISLSVSSPFNGTGKSKPEQQIIESNCSKSTPLLQTHATLVPMKPRLLFQRSEWAKSIKQQLPRTIGSRMPVPTQTSTNLTQSGNDLTPQHTSQPDHACTKSVPLPQAPKPNEAGTPELLEKSPSFTQQQLVGPGGHTNELTTTSQERCPVNQLAGVEVTQHVVAPDKPTDVGEGRSVSFAEGDSLLTTAFIVKNSSRWNVRNSLILPKCCQTKPKSSRTLKGILVEDKSRRRRRRSSPRPCVDIPSFPPGQAEAVRATKAANDAKKARDDGLAVQREHAAETQLVPVYNELLQVPAGLSICHFETE